MVSAVSKDTTEDLQKAAGASEAQAPGDQASLPAGQTQVLSEVGHTQARSQGKGELPAPTLRNILAGLALPRQWL